MEDQERQFVCEECGGVFYQQFDEEDFTECPYCGAFPDKFIENLSVEEIEEKDLEEIEEKEQEELDYVEDEYIEEDE